MAAERVTAAPVPVVLAAEGRVRWFAVGLALGITAAFTAASGWAALLRHEILGTGYLPRGAVPLFLLLVLVNGALRRLFPAWALNRTELALTFALLLAVAAVSGQEFGIHFYLNLAGLVYYSGPQSQWFNLFTPHLAPWLVPARHFRDPAILWAFEGMPTGARPPLGEWLVPLLAWTPYILGVYALLVCLCGLFSRQWEEHERLLYPLTQVPLELAGDRDSAVPSVLRQPLFWLGFWAAAVPLSLRGLHLYFPQIPDPRLQRTVAEVFGLAPGTPLFASGPLTAFNGLLAHLYPEMVGIAYLLSAEVGFSLWFFLFLRHAEVALRIALGQDLYHAEFLTFQSVGAYLVMAGAIVWVARGYLKGVVRGTLVSWAGRLKGERRDGPPEGWALVGGIAALALLLAWSHWVGQVSVLWAAVMLGGLMVAGLVVARVVAEAGIYIYSAPFRVNQILFDLLGKDTLGAKNIVLLTAMSWVQIRSTGTMATGYLSNAFRLSGVAGIPRREAAKWMLVAIALAVLVCHWVMPTVIYTYGVPKLSWWARNAALNTANLIGQYLTVERGLTVHHWAGLLLGMASCWALIKLRLTLVNFPLHPLGFITWLGWPIDRYWLSIFLGWAVKAAVVRFGGHRVFQRGKPLAYGLIVGGTTALTFWILLRLLYPTSESLIYD